MKGARGMSPSWLALLAVLVGLTSGCSRVEDLRERCAGDRNWSTPISQQRDKEPVTKAISNAIDVAPGMVIWDIGAGTGYRSRRLALEAGPQGRVVATDINEACMDFIEAAAPSWGVSDISCLDAVANQPMDQAALSLKNQGMAKLPPETREADRILLVNSISFRASDLDSEGFNLRPDPRNVIDNLYSGLKKGGKLVYYIDFDAEDCVNVDVLSDIFEESGFRTLSEQDPHSVMHPSKKLVGQHDRCRTLSVFTK